MPSLRLGNIAPDFEAETTAGPIKFHDWIGDSWVSTVIGDELEIIDKRALLLVGRSLLASRRLHPCLHH